MALAESVRLPPPTLTKVSIAGSSATASTLSSSCATGACCLVFEKVPAGWADPRSFSTCSMRGVFVAGNKPTLTYSFDFGDGRHDNRCFSTDGLPVVQAFKALGHPQTRGCILCSFSHECSGAGDECAGHATVDSRFAWLFEQRSTA